MPLRVGMITPSSNSVLEPVTAAMLADRADVTAHFSRLRVTEIALDAPALNQFDPSQMLPAAELLADAKVDFDRLERHLGELARDRARRKPVCCHSGKDRDCRDDVDAGLPGRGPARRGAADRAGQSLHG